MPKTKKTQTKNEFETKEPQTDTIYTFRSDNMLFSGVKLNITKFVNLIESKIDCPRTEKSLLEINLIRNKKNYGLEFILNTNNTLGIWFHSPKTNVNYIGGDSRKFDIKKITLPSFSFKANKAKKGENEKRLIDSLNRILGMFYICGTCDKVSPFKKCSECTFKDIVDPMEMEADICLICREKMIDGAHYNEGCCSQVYHSACFLSLSKVDYKCPICKEHMHTCCENFILEVKNDSDDEDDHTDTDD
jgi:hypothetical protein